jgi:hypothetical protein
MVEGQAIHWNGISTTTAAEKVMVESVVSRLCGKIVVRISKELLVEWSVEYKQ